MPILSGSTPEGAVAVGRDTERVQEGGISSVDPVGHSTRIRIDVYSKGRILGLECTRGPTHQRGLEQHQGLPAVTVQFLEARTNFFRLDDRAVNSLTETLQQRLEALGA
jgi:hypothetical protein